MPFPRRSRHPLHRYQLRRYPLQTHPLHQYQQLLRQLRHPLPPCQLHRCRPPRAADRVSRPSCGASFCSPSPSTWWWRSLFQRLPIPRYGCSAASSPLDSPSWWPESPQPPAAPADGPITTTGRPTPARLASSHRTRTAPGPARIGRAGPPLPRLPRRCW